MKIRPIDNRLIPVKLFAIFGIVLLLGVLFDKSIDVKYQYYLVFCTIAWIYFCITYFGYFKYIYMEVNETEVYISKPKHQYHMSDFFSLKKIRKFNITTVQLDSIKYYGIYKGRILKSYVENNNGYFNDTALKGTSPIILPIMQKKDVLFIVTTDGTYYYTDISEYNVTNQFKLEGEIQKNTGLLPFRFEAHSKVDKARKEYDMRNPKVWVAMAVIFFVSMICVAVGLLFGGLLIKLEIYLKPSHLIYNEFSRMRSIYYGTLVIFAIFPGGLLFEYLYKEKLFSAIYKKGMLISGGIVIVAFLAATYLNW